MVSFIVMLNIKKRIAKKWMRDECIDCNGWMHVSWINAKKKKKGNHCHGRHQSICLLLCSSVRATRRYYVASSVLVCYILLKHMPKMCQLHNSKKSVMSRTYSSHICVKFQLATRQWKNHCTLGQLLMSHQFCHSDVAQFPCWQKSARKHTYSAIILVWSSV